eukprot:tig00000980_g6127.t1
MPQPAPKAGAGKMTDERRAKLEAIRKREEDKDRRKKELLAKAKEARKAPAGKQQATAVDPAPLSENTAGAAQGTHLDMTNVSTQHGQTVPMSMRSSKGQNDEWAVFSEFNNRLWQEEQMIVAERTRLQKDYYKRELDRQIAEKKQREARSKHEDYAYSSKEDQELELWRQDEKRRQEELRLKHFHEREERERQMRDVEARRKRELQDRIQDEERMIRDYQEQMKLDKDMQARQKRELAKQMDRLKAENEKAKMLRTKILEEEREMDKMFMRKYEETEVKKERQRLADLEELKKKMQGIERIAMLTFQSQEEKARMDEERARKVQEEHDRAAAEEEAARQRRLRESNLQTLETLKKQLEEKHARTTEESKIEIHQAEIFKHEYEVAESRERKMAEERRLAARKHQQAIMDQIAEQRRRKMNEGRMMTDTERKLNQPLIEAIIKKTSSPTLSVPESFRSSSLPPIKS